MNPEGKPHRFSPLKSAPGSAGEIGIVCLVTKARAVWNDAAKAGWVADLNGAPFRAYYSARALLVLAKEGRIDQSVTHDGLTNCDAIARARRSLGE